MFNKAFVTALALALSACASAPTAEVTRFHLGQPIPRDTITVVASADPRAPGAAAPLEFATYAEIVGRELTRAGFNALRSGPSAYIAILTIEQTTAERIGGPPPISIGLGGFTGGRNVGVSTGVRIPVGGSRNNDVRVNRVSLRIRRVSDNSAIWEGRAEQALPAQSVASSMAASVEPLTRALLSNFPGASGQTVKVRL